jgi:predicted dehydrogenase
MDETNLSRRTFLKNSSIAAAAAIATPAILAAQDAPTGGPPVATPPNANERLRIGFIGCGGRMRDAHLKSAIRLQQEGKVEIAAACDVYIRNRELFAEQARAGTQKEIKQTGDYRDLINDASIDAVVIATPDHWHARQTIDALKAGKHVYCEKPMTHSVQEAIDVWKTWKESGRVMQVGVQSASLPVWKDANERIRNGQLGKVLMYQTEYFRNSDMGQWRDYALTRDMTPQTINWPMFLGTEFGLAPDMPFDRAKFMQWRCYWAFGAGMYTDLFVHRTTSMLLATGLRFPGRVVGAGGIFLEYDDRDVPDVATVVADFPEGVQGLVTATMCCSNTPITQLIRGHHGSFVFGNGEEFSGYDFKAERPQATRLRNVRDERIEAGRLENSSLTHFQNFCDAAIAGKPKDVNCSPELGAAAMVVVKLGSESYRQGKAFHFDAETLTVSEAGPSWAAGWEKMSHDRATPKHVSGWAAGDKGSVLFPRRHQRLAGPWINGVDPAAGT